MRRFLSKLAKCQQGVEDDNEKACFGLSVKKRVVSTEKESGEKSVDTE
jgi:hypothetical protein